MTDYKQLCGELVDVLAQYVNLPDDPEAVALLRRARAALAEPESEGPTDEQLIQLAIDTRLYRFQATAGDPVQYELTEQQLHAFARAVLTRWGRPTPCPFQNKEETSMDDLIEAVEAIRRNADDWKDYENNYRTGWWDACNMVLELLHARLTHDRPSSRSNFDD